MRGSTSFLNQFFGLREIKPRIVSYIGLDQDVSHRHEFWSDHAFADIIHAKHGFDCRVTSLNSADRLSNINRNRQVTCIGPRDHRRH